MLSTEIIDPIFSQYLIPHEPVEVLHTGMAFSEGPVYFAEEGYLLFSDIPNSCILRWQEDTNRVSVFREGAEFPNGNTRDREGRLITCEHGGRRVLRTERDGSVTVLVDRYQGKRLNSPNDAVVKSDNTIWFTDPPYGIIEAAIGYLAESEIGGNYVYRYDPADGELRAVATDFDMPNGLAFSLDERLLYIADSARSHGDQRPHHVRVFDVGDHGLLHNGRVFVEIEPGYPDGIRLDSRGNVWITACDGVHCYSAHGKLLGKIHTPETAANLTFGGKDRRRLFITASSSLHSIRLNIAGPSQP